MKQIPRWIILKYDEQPPVFLCERCGARRPPCLPAEVNDFVLQVAAFAESHKRCLPNGGRS